MNNFVIVHIKRIFHYNILIYIQYVIQIINVHFNTLDLKKVKKLKVTNTTIMKIDNDEQLLTSS